MVQFTESAILLRALIKKIKNFLLFNKLSAHKKIIYDTFVNKMGDRATIDFYTYNNSFPMFKKLLHNQNEEYNYYFIIPHFVDGTEHADKMINAIPKEKLILLDKSVPRVTGKYVAIYENIEKDIYISLEEILPLLSKYNTIKYYFT